MEKRTVVLGGGDCYDRGLMKESQLDGSVVSLLIMVRKCFGFPPVFGVDTKCGIVSTSPVVLLKLEDARTKSGSSSDDVIVVANEPC